MLKSRFSMIALALLLSVAPGGPTLYAQDKNKNQQVVPADPKVVKGKLANGLTYYIRPNSKPGKKVELRLVVNAGSILENEDQQGLAHFMEHMEFNGTQHYPKNKLIDFLQSIGVAFGADLNASTGFDETLYILPVPTDKPGNLEHGFQILEDWAHNALTVIEDDGEELDIVRGNMPFGDVGKGEFGTYFIGYARSPNRIEQMLENMFVGRPPGNYDRLLDFSRAVTGSLFFVPSVGFLEDAPDFGAPQTPDESSPGAGAPDGTLGIGSLKGESPHE